MDIDKSFNSLIEKYNINRYYNEMKFNRKSEDSKSQIYNSILEEVLNVGCECGGYEEIYYIRKRYINEKNDKLKEFYLEMLISTYLDIRDFLYGTKYINEYILSEYSRQDIYKQFLSDLNLLIETIKDKLRERKHKDIIMNWIDALCYDELSEMKYLSKRVDKGMFFENAFTVTAFTEQTMKTIFCKTKEIDDHQFEVNTINYDNSCLLRLLKDKGYKFLYVGHTVGFAFFDDEFLAENTKENRGSSPFVYWNVLRELLLNNQPCFLLAYTFFETHSPFICGNLDNFHLYDFEIELNKENKEIFSYAEKQNQMKQTKDYIDEELEYYSKILNSDTIKIYMSDHGKHARKYMDRLLHAILFVEGTNLKSEKFGKMFSYKNFYELVVYLLENNKENYDNLFSNLVEFQNCDMYSQTVVKYYIKNKEIINLLAYRGVRSKCDKYIVMGDKKEFYFILPDEYNNEIDNPKYKERINILRKEAGDYFIDVYKHEFFRYSRYTYDALDNYNKRENKNIKAINLINKLIDEIPKGMKVAIRGAGEHTVELMNVIRKKRKIECIIDINVKNKYNIRDCDIITIKDLDKYNIDVIIISSFDSRKEMKKEMESLGLNKRYDIIDIYDYFEENSLTLIDAFYARKFEEVDYENII